MVAIPPRQQEQTRQQGTARITPVREHYTTMRDATGNRLGGLLRALGCPLLGVLCAAPYYGSSEMSHVIPPHVFQVLKSHRWNCNVLGRRRKFGHPNYVRVLGCEARGSNSYVRGRRPNTLFMVPGTHQPACISADPHRIMDQRAQTAPARQHDHMHQLKYRLSRTRKPKRHPSSNTICPSS